MSDMTHEQIIECFKRKVYLCSGQRIGYDYDGLNISKRSGGKL